MGENLFAVNFLYVNYIFITENWARRELYQPNFLKWTNIMFLLQDTGQGKNLFTLIYCVFTLNWVGQEFFAPNTLYVCK